MEKNNVKPDPEKEERIAYHSVSAIKDLLDIFMQGLQEKLSR